MCILSLFPTSPFLFFLLFNMYVLSSSFFLLFQNSWNRYKTWKVKSQESKPKEFLADQDNGSNYCIYCPRKFCFIWQTIYRISPDSLDIWKRSFNGLSHTLFATVLHTQCNFTMCVCIKNVPIKHLLNVFTYSIRKGVLEQKNLKHNTIVRAFLLVALPSSVLVWCIISNTIKSEMDDSFSRWSSSTSLTTSSQKKINVFVIKIVQLQ